LIWKYFKQSILFPKDLNRDNIEGDSQISLLTGLRMSGNIFGEGRGKGGERRTGAYKSLLL
jgi:hypothetical protein